MIPGIPGQDACDDDNWRCCLRPIESEPESLRPSNLRIARTELLGLPCVTDSGPALAPGVGHERFPAHVAKHPDSRPSRETPRTARLSVLFAYKSQGAGGVAPRDLLRSLRLTAHHFPGIGKEHKEPRSSGGTRRMAAAVCEEERNREVRKQLYRSSFPSGISTPMDLEKTGASQDLQLRVFPSLVAPTRFELVSQS